MNTHRVSRISAGFGRLLLVALLFAGCAAERPQRTVRDSLDREVHLPPSVGRVVTLAPNLTEIVFAIGAGQMVVGTDDASDFPASARERPKVGAMQPDIEKILALRPDVVLASTEGNHPSLAAALAAAGVPLYVVKTDRLAEIAPAMRQVGAVLGAGGADAAATQLERGVAAAKRSRNVARKLMFAVWTDPLYVAGDATFTSDLFALTGAANAVTVSGWPQYPIEMLAAQPPELLLYPAGAVTPQQVEALLARLPGAKPQVLAVDQDLFQRPGPRVVEAAERLNELLDEAERDAETRTGSRGRR